MSPVMDLVLWEIKWHVEEIDGNIWLVPYCMFCMSAVGHPVDMELDHGATTAELLTASQHECAGHDDALRQVVYVRSKGARGVPFTPMKGPGVVPGQHSA